MNLKQTQILALREAANVQRCHTIQYDGSYDIAKHSYNALNLLLILFPETIPPSLSLIKAVLWHDIPERWTGDVPSPAKWSSPILKNALQSIEARIFKKLELNKCFENLTKNEKTWLRGVDLLELYLWVIEQLEGGNRLVFGIKRRIDNVFRTEPESFPKEILEFVEAFRWQRLPEVDELLEVSYDN